MKKTFNEEVKRMYKENIKSRREQIHGIHKVNDTWYEYTDGKVLLREKNPVMYDKRESEIKSCPTLCADDVRYPNTNQLFHQEKLPIKSKIKFMKAQLQKLLDCMEKEDVVELQIRSEKVAVFFKVGVTKYGLIMPVI